MRMFVCRACERLVLFPYTAESVTHKHVCGPCLRHINGPEAHEIDDVCTKACADVHAVGMYAAGEYMSVRAKYQAAFSWLREQRVAAKCKGRRSRDNPPPFKSPKQSWLDGDDVVDPPDDGKGGWRDSDGEDWKGDSE